MPTLDIRITRILYMHYIRFELTLHVERLPLRTTYKFFIMIIIIIISVLCPNKCTETGKIRLELQLVREYKLNLTYNPLLISLNLSLTYLSLIYL